MDQEEKRSITLIWSAPLADQPNRLTISTRPVLALGGVLLFAVFSCLLMGAVAVHLQKQTAALYARCADMQARCGVLEDRVATFETEVSQARAGLARVRTEEVKIRSWLGLDSDEGVGDSAVQLGDTGGKGSLGEEDLDSVDPSARSAEAEEIVQSAVPGIVEESEALATDLANLASHLQRQRERWDSIPTISPVDGEHWVSSAFGWRRSPFTGNREFHSGIDMAGKKGTPVVATANGTVTKVFNDSALGKGISIDHGNSIRTIYGHLEKILVNTGETVQRGETIGKMGSSGKRSTGPHLHYAIKVDGKYVNPKDYLLDRGQLPFAVAGP